MDCKIKELDLKSLSKEELIHKVQAMGLHIRQLQNIIAKSGDTRRKPEQKKQRDFDFKKYRRRHVLLRVCYLGWDYQGLASQEDTPHTIEAELFRALQLTKLVAERQTSNYHRCGRTDKGVSAFSQVVSLDVRSKQRVDLEEPDAPASLEPADEINYTHLLNKVLPEDIRVLAWAPAAPDFSARFDCRGRTYRYFFPRGSLDLEAMQRAADRLRGSHDFRNLCKMDVGNGVVGYTRELRELHVQRGDGPDDAFQMCQLVVRGNAFLWHQIRCIVAVLFMVGEHLEEESVIDKLLDVKNYPRKPQYNMASEVPLNLFAVEYGEERWHWDSDVTRDVITTLERLWTGTAVKSAMLRAMLCELGQQHGPLPGTQAQCLVNGVRAKVYTPLFERPTCESLEERVGYYVKRRRLDPSVLQTVQEAAAASPSSPGADPATQTSPEAAAAAPAGGGALLVEKRRDQGSVNVENSAEPGSICVEDIANPGSTSVEDSASGFVGEVRART